MEAGDDARDVRESELFVWASFEASLDPESAERTLCIPQLQPPRDSNAVGMG
jgi:hypothetical protein